MYRVYLLHFNCLNYLFFGNVLAKSYDSVTRFHTMCLHPVTVMFRTGGGPSCLLFFKSYVFV